MPGWGYYYGYLLYVFRNMVNVMNLYLLRYMDLEYINANYLWLTCDIVY